MSGPLALVSLDCRARRHDSTPVMLLAAIAAGLWILLFERTRVASWSLGLSLLLLINLKFSGIYYAGLILMAMTAVMPRRKVTPASTQ